MRHLTNRDNMRNITVLLGECASGSPYGSIGLKALHCVESLAEREKQPARACFCGTGMSKVGCDQGWQSNDITGNCPWTCRDLKNNAERLLQRPTSCKQLAIHVSYGKTIRLGSGSKSLLTSQGAKKRATGSEPITCP